MTVYLSLSHTRTHAHTRTANTRTTVQCKAMVHAARFHHSRILYLCPCIYGLVSVAVCGLVSVAVIYTRDIINQDTLEGRTFMIWHDVLYMIWYIVWIAQQIHTQRKIERENYSKWCHSKSNMRPRRRIWTLSISFTAYIHTYRHTWIHLVMIHTYINSYNIQPGQTGCR